MRRGAIFDPTGTYRYTLSREWDAAGPLAVFVMLNPSTANAERDDPTIRRCIGLSRAWGYGRLRVVNLFAYRTPYPAVLAASADPVGPENDRHLKGAAQEAMLVVLAWGNTGRLGGRDREVAQLFAQPHCLGLTKLGNPRHPLYVRRDARPSPL